MEELQGFQDKWENSVILADDELCQAMREDLHERPEVIPQEAVEASLLAQEADAFTEALSSAQESEASGQEGEEAEEKEIEEAAADFAFPSPENKEWLLPLNLGNEPSVEYLFYARAEDAERGRYIDLLFEVPVKRPGGEMVLDEDGKIIWECLAYDAGAGWTIYTPLEEE